MSKQQQYKDIANLSIAALRESHNDVIRYGAEVAKVYIKARIEALEQKIEAAECSDVTTNLFFDVKENNIEPIEANI